MQPVRTIIVDDEPRIRRGIERLVRAMGDGWEVAAMAADGQEALDAMGKIGGAFDLLITDVKMPEMDGLTLIQKAKARYAFHSLLISGFDDFKYVQTALREGALDYILKPVDREQFRLRMTELRETIARERLHEQRQGEMQREAGKLKKSRQIQTLACLTSADIDVANLGFWVDEFPSGRFLLLLVRLDSLPVKTRSFTAKDWKAYYYALENMIGEVVDTGWTMPERCGWSYLGGESDFWVLLHSAAVSADAHMEQSAQKLAEQIRAAIQKYTPFTVTVSFGDAIEDLYLLPEAKRQAAALLNYRFLYGGNKVFHTGSFERLSTASQERQPERSAQEATALARKLKRCVEQGDRDEASRMLRILFERLAEAATPSLLQNAVLNVILLLHSAWLENRAGPDDTILITEQIQQVRRASDLHELKRCVNQLIERVIDDLAVSRQTGNMKPVEQAKKWIGEHLAETVTIKRIAEQVYMNPTYFSEYFKMQTGETILDYLTRQRIETAKLLLTDSSLKLHDISSRIGYQDAKYFSRLFKTWTGQTPTQYRERAAAGNGGGRVSQ